MDERPVEKISAWMPVTLEMAADAGWPLTDDEHAILAERAAKSATYRRSWRYLYRRIRWEVGARLSHAWRALRGIDCERDC